jgi:hypothetical protein
MTDETIRVEIEGENPAPTPSSRPPATDEAALTRAAFAERAQAQTEALEAKRDFVAAKLYEIEARSHLAKEQIQKANESGDWEQLAERQQEISRLEAQRHSFELAQLSRAQVPPADPIEAFISGRASATQAWLRAHPDDARALALSVAGQASVDDQRRSAKINAAHNDAVAEGLDPDTPKYFAYVEEFLERRSRPSRSGSDEPKVNFIRRDDPTPAGHVRLSKAEYEKATDGTLVWNYGPNKGKPLGAHEYARRKIAMKNTHPERLG